VENWKDPASGEWVQTFAIITTDANELVADIHDRMPVILARSDYTRWLGEEPDPRRREFFGLRRQHYRKCPTRGASNLHPFNPQARFGRFSITAPAQNFIGRFWIFLVPQRCALRPVPPDAGEGRAQRPDVVARNQARRLSADGAANALGHSHPHPARLRLD
jgi:SOS response associated peptidase (SRAP)